LLLVLMASLLPACVSVSNNWDPLGYTVKTGDTLYSIAWRYEKDYRDIARWNNISAPYAIYPGQRLVMTADNLDGTVDHRPPEDVVIEAVPEPDEAGSAEPPPPPVQPQRPNEIIVSKGDTLYSLARDQELKVAQLARWNFIRRPYRIHPGQRLRLHPPGVSVAPVISDSRPAQPSRPASPPAAAALPARVSQWTWPAHGQVIKTSIRTARA